MPELPNGCVVTIYDSDEDENDQFILDHVMTIESGIYALINTLNGNWYIGSSKQLRIRAQRHQKQLQTGKHENCHLQYAWNKYGENKFVFRVIEYCEIKDLLIKEQYWLDLLKPEYNIAKIAGSTRGCKHPPLSPEHIKKIIEVNTGRIVSQETRQLLSKRKMGQGKGIPLSQEHRDRISKGSKGRIITPEHRENLSKALKGRACGYAVICANKTHCPKGHEYTAENTFIQKGRNGNPNRYCRECKRIRDYNRYHKSNQKMTNS